MYDAHHRQLARIYILVLIFFFSAVALLSYLLPASTVSDIEARLSGAVHSPVKLAPEYIAEIARPATVLVYSTMDGVLSMPSISASYEEGRFVVAVSEEPSDIEIEVNDYVQQGTGVYVDDNHIATAAHVVSPEWVYYDTYIELIDNALGDVYWDAYIDDSVSATEFEAIEEAYQRTDAYIIAKELYPTFRERMRVDITHTIFVVGAGDAGKNYRLGDEAILAAEFGGAYEFDDLRDVALLFVEPRGISTLRLSSSDAPPSVGSTVYAIGYPSTADVGGDTDYDASFTRGAITSTKIVDTNVERYEIDIRSASRSSGSPVLDEYGEVIAFVAERTGDQYAVEGDSFTYAVPVRYLRELAVAADISFDEEESAALLYGAFADLAQGDCADARDAFEDIDERALRHSDTRFAAEYGSRCEGAEDAGAIASVGQWFETADRIVVVLIGSLATLIFVLFVVLLYLRARLLKEEKEVGSLKRFVSRMHKENE